MIFQVISVVPVKYCPPLSINNRCEASTLEYCFSIVGLEARKDEDSDIVGLIPSYYDQDQALYAQLDSIEPSKVDLDKIYKKKHMKVSPKKKNVDLIDISKIGE